MKLRVIACEIFFREICLLVANSPHRCELEFLPKGLHDLGRERMAARLQERIDAVPEHTCDAIVLAYGLCNNGIVGLSSRHTRLIVPRAHDCITLFLGSRERYKEEFERHPGTYYRTTGWLERDDSGSAGEMTVTQQLGMSVRYEELVEQYGEDNARYVMETLGDGLANYDRLAYIRMGLECEEDFREMAEHEARRREWLYAELKGDISLLRKLFYGDWDDDFLILPPGQTIKAAHDDSVVGGVQCAD